MQAPAHSTDSCTLTKLLNIIQAPAHYTSSCTFHKLLHVIQAPAHYTSSQDNIFSTCSCITNFYKTIHYGTPYLKKMNTVSRATFAPRSYHNVASQDMWGWLMWRNPTTLWCACPRRSSRVLPPGKQTRCCWTWWLVAAPVRHWCVCLLQVLNNLSSNSQNRFITMHK